MRDRPRGRLPRGRTRPRERVHRRRARESSGQVPRARRDPALCRLLRCLTEKIELFCRNGQIFRKDDELFTETSWAAVMMGQGITMNGHNATVDTLDFETTRRELDEIERSVRFLLQHMPPHADYLARYCLAKGGLRGLRPLQGSALAVIPVSGCATPRQPHPSSPPGWPVRTGGQEGIRCAPRAAG
ncbi:MAG: tryptophan 7-halogenase [Alteraurantiacibacter sp.]|nr:tryptophan 7-halogenase [Alteraurantiacibacter sp.]